MAPKLTENVAIGAEMRKAPSCASLEVARRSFAVRNAEPCGTDNVAYFAGSFFISSSAVLATFDLGYLSMIFW